MAVQSRLGDGNGPTVFTVGHSTRSLQQLVGILQLHAIQLLVDVRRYPGSRRHPHFAKGKLERALPEAGIRYRHEEALGGRRRPVQESRNRAWRVGQFQGYADHMATPSFQEALARVLRAAPNERVAVMCAEAVPERCHRRLLADAILAQGGHVVHLLDERRTRPHGLTEFARVRDGVVTYPG